MTVLARRRGNKRLTGLFLAGALAASLPAPKTFADEVCRYGGTTDYAGQVAVVTRVSAADGVTKVDVVATFRATTMLWFHIRYLIEEISTWRAGELERVAVNNRYFVDGHIVRQQWDDFHRGITGLQGYRLQGKSLTEFRRKYPGFALHWDPASFGRPWLDDYQSASPERRADLDLNGAPLPPRLSSPLALTFYWVRWLPRDGQAVSVFLPGIKGERLVELPIVPAAVRSGTAWQAPLHYPALNGQRPSTATAWTSADQHLLQLAFDLHSARGSAQGLIRQQGCEGSPVAPASGPR